MILLTRKIARLIVLLVFVSLLAWHLEAHAAPSAGDRAQKAGYAPLSSTEMTTRTITEFELALGEGSQISDFFAMDAVLTLGETGEQVRGRAEIADAVEQ